MMRLGKTAKIAGAILSLLSLPIFSHAEETDDLEVNITNIPAPGEAKEKRAPAPEGAEQFSDDAETTDEQRRAYYAAFPDRKSSVRTRFSLTNRNKFRSWIQNLCEQEAVAEEEAARVRLSATRNFITRPRNKQGSLQLLLENYVDDMELQAKCERQQKQQNNSACSMPDRNLGKQSWVPLASWKAQAKSGSDFAALTSENRKSRQTVFRKEFWELRETAQLNGKPASATEARKILAALKDDSTCRTRAVETGRWSSPFAQK